VSPPLDAWQFQGDDADRAARAVKGFISTLALLRRIPPAAAALNLLREKRERVRAGD